MSKVKVKGQIGPSEAEEQKITSGWVAVRYSTRRQIFRCVDVDSPNYSSSISCNNPHRAGQQTKLYANIETGLDLPAPSPSPTSEIEVIFLRGHSAHLDMSGYKFFTVLELRLIFIRGMPTANSGFSCVRCKFVVALSATVQIQLRQNRYKYDRTRTRTRSNTNPNGTEASAAGRSVRVCVETVHE